MDTDTLVSAIGWTGPPAQILAALIEGKHDLIVSGGILDELTRALRYPRLRSVATRPDLPRVLEWLHQPEHVVIPQERLDAVPGDPADNVVLGAAIAGKADVVVSGDRHLLRLGSFRGIPILSARAFVAKHL